MRKLALMEITTMSNAMHKPRVLVGCPQAAGRALISPISGMGQGTGVSAFAIGGAAAVHTTRVVVDPAFYATPKSLNSDVAFVGSGRPPV
jgi:sulfite reductase beta subunit-like hemoprotein